MTILNDESATGVQLRLPLKYQKGLKVEVKRDKYLLKNFAENWI